MLTVWRSHSCGHVCAYKHKVSVCLSLRSPLRAAEVEAGFKITFRVQSNRKRESILHLGRTELYVGVVIRSALLPSQELFVLQIICCFVFNETPTLSDRLSDCYTNSVCVAL